MTTSTLEQRTTTIDAFARAICAAGKTGSPASLAPKVAEFDALLHGLATGDGTPGGVSREVSRSWAQLKEWPNLPSVFASGPGHAYGFQWGRTGRGWQVRQLGAAAASNPRGAAASGAEADVPMYQWSHGRYLLARRGPGRGPATSITERSARLPEGTRSVFWLQIVYASGATPTVFRVAETLRTVDVIGAPEPTALLASFTLADLQSAAAGDPR